MEDKDWEAACAQIRELHEANEKLRVQRAGDAEIIRTLRLRIEYLEGQVSAYEFCARHGREI